MFSFFATSGLATLTLNLTTLMLGLFFAKISGLSQPQQMSIAIEVGLQMNIAAILIAGTLINNPTMAIPGATYSLFMFLTGYIFCYLFSAHSNKQARLIKNV